MSRAPLPPWTKRDNLSTPPHQRIVDKINALSPLTPPEGSEFRSTPVGSGIVDKRPLTLVPPLIGVVVAAGPAGEADYSDERYWVRISRIDGTSAVTDLRATPATELTTSYNNREDNRADIVTATNLTENSLDKETSGIPRYEKGTHLLPLGRRVVVWSDIDTANPNNTRYFMAEAVSRECIVKVTAAKAGFGKYDGKIMYPKNADWSPYTDLVIADFTEGPDCWIENLAEVGQSGNALTDDGANRVLYKGTVRPRSKGSGGYEDEDGNEVDPNTLVGGETAVADRPVVIIGDYDWESCPASRAATTPDYYGS
jgi:hypothetical protein